MTLLSMKIAISMQTLFTTARATYFGRATKTEEGVYDQNAKQYNKGKTKLSSFQVGDIVWKKNYVLSDASKFFAAKLAPHFRKDQT
jgi:hypothetical protein